MPRTWLVLRHLALTLGSLLTCLVAGGAAGVLYGRGADLLVVLATLPLLLCLFGTVLVWFIGEDDLDTEPNWIVPMVFVSLLLTGPISFGLPVAYLHAFGDRVAVVVTEDTAGAATPGSYQTVRVADIASGEEVGELAYHAATDLQVGDRLEAVVDPLDWFAPDTTQPVATLRAIGYGLTAAGLALLLSLTVLRTRRDLRRYRLTGTRLPPERSVVPQDRRRQSRERHAEPPPEPDLADLDGVPERADYGGSSDDAAGGGDWGD